MKYKSLIILAASFGLIAAAPAKEGREKQSKKKDAAEAVEKPEKEDKAAEEPEAEVKAEKKMKGGKRQAELLEKFDKNGDGELDAEEKDAVKADKKQKLIEQFDEDKDGQLNEEESAKMQELIQKRHDSHKKQ